MKLFFFDGELDSLVAMPEIETSEDEQITLKRGIEDGQTPI